jgi:lipooligosaccharide transport system permease protein
MVAGRAGLHATAEPMSAHGATLALRVVPVPTGGGLRLVERNYVVFRRSWPVFLTGFLEPVFYLLSIGVGISRLVPGFPGPDGRLIGYTEFIAPALLATSAMNGAIFDATYNVFFKLKYAKLYDSILATPLGPADVARGEVTWALLRGGAYSAMFVVVMAAMGLVSSAWAVLAWPAALLIGYGFAGIGMGLTTFMRSWQDFEWIQLALLPMFLFSGTFYPLSTYPSEIRWLVEITPLYQCVHLVRGLTTGNVSPSLLVPVVYLLALGSIGLAVATGRLGRLLLR